MQTSFLTSYWVRKEIKTEIEAYVKDHNNGKTINRSLQDTAKRIVRKKLVLNSYINKLE